MRTFLIILILIVIAQIILFIKLWDGSKPDIPEPVLEPVPVIEPVDTHKAEAESKDREAELASIVQKEIQDKPKKPEPRPKATIETTAVQDTVKKDSIDTFFDDLEDETAVPAEEIADTTDDVSFEELAAASPAKSVEQINPELEEKIVNEKEKQVVAAWQKKTLKDYQVKVKKDFGKYYTSLTYKVLGKWNMGDLGTIQFFADGTGHSKGKERDKQGNPLLGSYHFRYKIANNILTLIPILTKESGQKIIAYYIVGFKDNIMAIGPYKYKR